VIALLGPDVAPMIRLAAARLVIEQGVKWLELEDQAARIAALEAKWGNYETAANEEHGGAPGRAGSAGAGPAGRNWRVIG
jgi:hypothetical protein